MRQTDFKQLLVHLTTCMYLTLNILITCKAQGTVNPLCDINPVKRFDCHPEKFPTKDRCVKRGCCWLEDRKKLKVDAQNEGANGPPKCYYPLDFPAYSITNITGTALGIQVQLQRNSSTYYPKDIKSLKMEVMFETNTCLHVKISDATLERYEVPLSVPKPTARASDPQYTVSTGRVGNRFTLEVGRKGDNQGIRLFQTDSAAPLIFTDQFLQLSSVLPSQYLYGLGEHRQSLLLDLNWTRLALWNVDHAPLENTNLYGSHPFYLMLEENGNCSGFFLLNSNAMDVTLQPTPAITWRSTGGILDFYIFTGPTPADVMHQFTRVIGRTFMPPYWSLGFHVCRYGYKSVNDTMTVTDRIRKYRIPQDVQWNDLDYMLKKMDFTSDTARFGDQAAMVQELHNRGMKYIVIVDPGISSSQPKGSYRPYDLGVELDIFMKNNSGQELVGMVWPGSCVFPDFSNPLSHKYWTTLIGEFRQNIQVDGLWIDMNEISNFVSGSIHGCPDTEYDHPPYLPDVEGGSLYHRTICPSAIQHISRSYNLHNLYGLMETNATYNGLRSSLEGKRPFVISRSTYSGQGQYGGHWTGDNFATYHDLYRSISGIITLNLAGIPMVGADICGFNLDTTYELCLRWYQLGAFYPFSRSHNSKIAKKDQDPGAFDANFASVVRSVYEVRYSLLPLLYTLFYNSHVTGEPVARGMFYQFPGDSGSLGVDTQFMWGSQLLIAPVITEHANTVDVYLPPDTVWYNYTSGITCIGKGDSVRLYAPVEVLNLLVQGGTIIPTQDPALTTSESRQNEFSLLIALGLNGTASGSLYWDEGDLFDFEGGKYNYMNFTFKQGKLMSYLTNYGYQATMELKAVKFFGFSKNPSKVVADGVSQQFEYNSQHMVLSVPDLKPRVSLLKNFVIEID